ncbi:hypothetical protein [Ralstonia solanacearum]|uniref:Uncharacterized protein n=2 Tax=Ralstonia solanacearum TaxID=305 RepID=A0A5H2PPC9_RALSL|nr:hypothetical protein [Ralstonia solanacearum]AEG70622.1 conserved hypothetical protein [Ralstonia solanacearum Po82]AMP68702.1 hypothetical protein UW163_04015 [Ralstonia solanacearum]AMP74387.1 hypothetical protein RALBFv3_09555 [Ralstonia solanacearum]AYB61990.1 hypothetical protein C2124_16260 [Ralstonia solanacearum]EUJ13394.1 hypothetical protein RSP673_16090 [Ralstonia solanacearum P673]
MRRVIAISEVGQAVTWSLAAVAASFCVGTGVAMAQILNGASAPVTAGAGAASGGSSTPVALASPVALTEWLATAILVCMIVVLLLTLLLIVKALRRQNWNLAEALSEEAALPEGTPTPAAGQKPPLVASTSRLIALVGTVILGTFFTGIGFYVVWELFHAKSVDAASGAWTFFLSGAVLFTPYGTNKIAKIFQAN